jgi:hypothetical protein
MVHARPLSVISSAICVEQLKPCTFPNCHLLTGLHLEVVTLVTRPAINANSPERRYHALLPYTDLWKQFHRTNAPTQVDGVQSRRPWLASSAIRPVGIFEKQFAEITGDSLVVQLLC